MDYFLDRYFVRVKKVSRRRVKKTMSPAQFNRFKRDQDKDFQNRKNTIENRQFSRMDLLQETNTSVMRAIQGVIAELETIPNVELSKHVFKPFFRTTRVNNRPDFTDFMLYFTKILSDAVKSNLKELFLTPSIGNLLLIDLRYIKANIHDLVSIPKIGKLAIPIIEQKEGSTYLIDSATYRVMLSFEKRKKYLFKINDKKGTIPQLIQEGAIPHVPVITMKGHKLIINLPFEVKRKVLSKQTQKVRKKNKIEIGVDLGL